MCLDLLEVRIGFRHPDNPGGRCGSLGQSGWSMRIPRTIWVVDADPSDHRVAHLRARLSTGEARPAAGICAEPGKPQLSRRLEIPI
eukprot:6888243-Pyramimonas_sp.AAC.1